MKSHLFKGLLVMAVAIGLSSAVIGRTVVDSSDKQVETEVRKVFDAWGAALTQGDKKTYLGTFWNSPLLVIRVAQGEWRGFDEYRQRIEGATLPPGNSADYRNVQVVALGTDGAVVTYERPAPAMAPGSANIIFRGTVVF
ncbi:MAG TPA: hypothetical protein VEZ90_10880, partial [Blastocatellia bacterium]|nr:hypothetical protein [Blastocatellia bacterium]